MSRAFSVAVLLVLGISACGQPGHELEEASHGRARDAGAGADADAGDTDAGDVDSGVVDAGDVDSGVVDAGVVDSGVVDSGVVDSGIVDAGVMDSGVSDSGVLDSGVRDAGVADAGVGDAGAVDAGPPPPRFWWSNETFTPSDSPNAVWGDGHVHSTYSDGAHTALEMINKAHSLNADFVWITDHGATPTSPGGISENQFDACSTTAGNQTTASQFAGCGVEYRLGYTRANGTKVWEAWHQVVQGILPSQFGSAISSNGYASWTAYQNDLAALNNVYATLTHPAGPLAWYDDDDSAFADEDPSHHPDVELCELNGGDDDGTNGNNLLDGIHTYFRFLNDGWQVSPVWNSDMHAFYGGDEKAKGYGAWIDKSQWGVGNHRALLRKAARQHQTFANHPGNEKNYLRMITLTGTGGTAEAMMGSTLAPRASLTLRIKANINGGNKRWHFRIYTNKDRTFASPYLTAAPADTDSVSGGDEQQWEVTFPTTGLKWVVAYASPDTGTPGSATQYLVSAPVWLNNQ